MRYLLSNNMSYEDRTAMERMWKGQRRVTNLGWFAGFFVGGAVITMDPIVKKWALGWRGFAMIGCAAFTKMMICQYYSRNYGPIIGAFLRKYQDVGATDAWEIRDRKREYYQIDDS